MTRYAWVLHTKDEYEQDEYRDDHFTSKEGALANADDVALNAGFEAGKVVDGVFGEWTPDNRRQLTITVVYPGDRSQRTYFQSIDRFRLFADGEGWEGE